jgi:hypothetical protein
MATTYLQSVVEEAYEMSKDSIEVRPDVVFIVIYALAVVFILISVFWYCGFEISNSV